MVQPHIRGIALECVAVAWGRPVSSCRLAVSMQRNTTDEHSAGKPLPNGKRQNHGGTESQRGKAAAETAEYAKYAEAGTQSIPYSAYSAVPFVWEVARRLRSNWSIAV